MKDSTGFEFFVFVQKAVPFPSTVRNVLNALADSHRFAPSVWGFSAPFENEFSSDVVEEVLENFAKRPAWDSLFLQGASDQFGYILDRKPRDDGLWHVSGGFDRGVISCEEDAALLIELADGMINACGVDFGYVVNGNTPGADLPLDLKTRLPDIPNVMYLGDACVAAFSKPLVDTAPADLEWLSDSCAKIKVSDSLLEPVDKDRQDSIRHHFGDEWFMKHPKRRYKSGKSPFSTR